MRRVALAVPILALGALIVYVAWPSRPTPKGPTQDQFVVDQAELIPAESEERMNRLLRALLRDTDVELVAASVASLEGVEMLQFTERLFERWRVGSRTRGNRGLLLLIAAEEKRVRLAVSYELEGLFPDALVAYVEQAQMVPYFRDNRIGEGIEATVELIAGQAFEQITGEAYDPAARGEATMGGSRSGGAGAETTVPPEGASGASRPAVEETLRAHFGAQPTPVDAWERFLEAHRRRIKDPELGIYDEAARAHLRQRPNTDAGQDHVATLYANQPYVVREQGERAAIVFLDDPNHLLAPWFFRRAAEGWRLDGAMYPRLIAYNHLNQWRFTRRDHPYAFAFTDYVFDKNGFATPKPAP